MVASEKSIGRLFYPKTPSPGRRMSGSASERSVVRGPRCGRLAEAEPDPASHATVTSESPPAESRGSPAPRRTMTGGSTARSTTVVGSAVHAPGVDDEVEPRAQRRRGSPRHRSAARCSPGSISVDDRMGSPSSCSSACATAWSGTRTPTVLRFGCCSRRGTSRVAGSRKVYAPGRALPDDPELPVVELREMADLGQVAQHERQEVRFVDAANLANAPRRRRVADVAAERVAGIGGIGDDPAVPQDRRRLPDEARLRIGGMHLEELGHDRRRASEGSAEARAARRGSIIAANRDSNPPARAFP